MSERAWCQFPNCDAPDEQVGTCDICGIEVCEHHCVILADNDWRCWDCSEVREATKFRWTPVVIAACIIAAAIVLSFVSGCGCSAHKHKYPDAWHHKPTKAPLMPKDRGCGQDITFENGETWNYPCWPWKAEPKCVSGC